MGSLLVNAVLTINMMIDILYPTGHVYTGVVGGKIVRFADDLRSYTTVARVGKPPYDICDNGKSKAYREELYNTFFHH